MKTRFDSSDVWMTTAGEPIHITSMETPHILNTVKMLVQKPTRTLTMLVIDIERASYSDAVWTANRADDLKKSLNNVTSLSEEELIRYVIETPLFKALVAELDERGVNVENILNLYVNSES